MINNVEFMKNGYPMMILSIIWIVSKFCFVDSIAFGLSNRVLDALKSNTLIVGFKESFTGYNLKILKV